MPVRISSSFKYTSIPPLAALHEVTSCVPWRVFPRHRFAALGFTLIELMIAVAVVGIVLGAIYGVLIAANRSYYIQDRVVESQQKLRIGLYLMARDIRMAGLDPRNTKNFGIELAERKKIRFTADLNWTTWEFDNDLPQQANRERVTYEFVADSKAGEKASFVRLGLYEGTGSQSWETFIENVSGLRFEYLDADGNTIATPVAEDELADIRTVAISMVAETGAKNPAESSVQRRVSTLVRCRNL